MMGLFPYRRRIQFCRPTLHAAEQPRRFSRQFLLLRTLTPYRESFSCRTTLARQRTFFLLQICIRAVSSPLEVVPVTPLNLWWYNNCFLFFFLAKAHGG